PDAPVPIAPVTRRVRSHPIYPEPARSLARCGQVVCIGGNQTVIGRMSAPPVPGRWELRTCARRGHVTYAPDDETLAHRLSGLTGLGEVWVWLRCGEFPLGAPHVRGPADDAPMVLRGKALRQAIIVRALAVERWLRAVLIGLAAWAVWKFRGAQGSIQAAVERDLPLLPASGIKVDQMTAIHELEKALATKPNTLILLFFLLAAYALLELIEGVGLWLLARWGEYFAVV